jgi:NAD(P)-dependent dehydrogenase (short-subunit alcohol dehydrogenase family)
VPRGGIAGPPDSVQHCPLTPRPPLTFTLDAQALARDLAALSALAAAAPRSAPVTALITGANAGIGFTLAGMLARCGVRVVLACRNEARGTAAVKRIRDAVGPSADVRLVLLDVSDPASVLAAAAACRGDESLGLTGGLSYLFLNAGVMPLSRYRWEVAAQAALIGGLGHFLTTGRAHEGSAHFLGQPQDALGYGGSPATFATNVLGHLLLVEELAPLLAAAAAAARSGAPLPAGGRKGAGAAPAPAAAGGSAAGGRVVWTGSRAATTALLEWAHLAPPAGPGQPSGHQAWLAAPSPVVLGEAYGESKAATDLLNVSRSVPAADDCGAMPPAAPWSGRCAAQPVVSPWCSHVHTRTPRPPSVPTRSRCWTLRWRRATAAACAPS